MSALLEIKSEDAIILIPRKEKTTREVTPTEKSKSYVLYNVGLIVAVYRLHHVENLRIKHRKRFKRSWHNRLKCCKHMNQSMEVGLCDFHAQTKQPSGSSISFVNATGLVALKIE